MKLFQCCLYMLITIAFASCYSYGPTHEPYIRKKVTLPPPFAKVVGIPDSKAEYLQKTYTEIKNALSEADVVMIEDSIKVLFPDNIVYNNREMLPSTDYLPSLEKFATLLKKYKKTNILVTGHSDSKGNETINKEISTIRALNIKNILITDGVNTSRLKSWGLGSSSPIADNETIEGRTKNRRVEFVVLYQD